MKKLPLVQLNSKSGNKAVITSPEKTIPAGSILIHKKRIKHKDKTITQYEEADGKRTVDTTLIRKLIHLRSAHL